MLDVEWFDLPLGGVLELPPVDAAGIALELRLLRLGQRSLAWWSTDSGALVAVAEVGEA